MAHLPGSDWQSALDRMDASLSAALKALERAEERWERAVAPSAGEGEPPVALDRLGAGLLEWDERLCGADELAASLEQELTDRASAVERWRTLFARWEELLQQRPHV